MSSLFLSVFPHKSSIHFLKVVYIFSDSYVSLVSILNNFFIFFFFAFQDERKGSANDDYYYDDGEYDDEGGDDADNSRKKREIRPNPILAPYNLFIREGYKSLPNRT